MWIHAWVNDNSIILRNRLNKIRMDNAHFYEKSIYQNISLCNVLSHVSTMYFIFWWMILLTYASSSHPLTTLSSSRGSSLSMYVVSKVCQSEREKSCALAITPLYYSKNITHTEHYSPFRLENIIHNTQLFFPFLYFIVCFILFFPSPEAARNNISSSDSNSMYIIYDTRGSILD